MKRLRGSDAFGIYSETPTSPFVTLKVAIYRAVDQRGIPDTEAVKGFIKAKIASTGRRSARLRIMRVPFDLHHPVWVADPHFSPDDHIHHATLPPPGDKAGLCDFLSELMGKPLDPERPRWEIWVIDGLQDERLAIAFKVHHSLADGKTIAAMIEKSHSRTSEDDAKAVADEGEPIPGKSRLLWDALVDLVKSYTLELPRFYHHLKQARQSAAGSGGGDEDIVKPFSAPHTIFNRSGGSERIYRYESFALPEFKALSRVLDCTINTLVLGVCSEALKRYLAEQGALPAESLITGMPVGDRGGKNVQTLLNSDIQNNNLAVAVLPLFQDIEDFEQRLRAIKRASRAAIDHVIEANGRRFDNYLDFLPGTFVRLVNAAMLRMQENRRGVYANLVISNVAGPRQPLYALDGRLEMEELLSVGNLTDAGNLNITVWSYVDELCFSLYSRKGALPEPDKINAHLRNVVAELKARYLSGTPQPRAG